jgi:hypothetical protein
MSLSNECRYLSPDFVSSLEHNLSGQENDRSILFPLYNPRSEHYLSSVQEIIPVGNLAHGKSVRA